VRKQSSDEKSPQSPSKHGTRNQILLAETQRLLDLMAGTRVNVTHPQGDAVLHGLDLEEGELKLWLGNYILHLRNERDEATDVVRDEQLDLLQQWDEARYAVIRKRRIHLCATRPEYHHAGLPTNPTENTERHSDSLRITYTPPSTPQSPSNSPPSSPPPPCVPPLPSSSPSNSKSHTDPLQSTSSQLLSIAPLLVVESPKLSPIPVSTAKEELNALPTKEVENPILSIPQPPHLVPSVQITPTGSPRNSPIKEAKADGVISTVTVGSNSARDVGGSLYVPILKRHMEHQFHAKFNNVSNSSADTEVKSITHGIAPHGFIQEETTPQSGVDETLSHPWSVSEWSSKDELTDQLTKVAARVLGSTKEQLAPVVQLEDHRRCSWQLGIAIYATVVIIVTCGNTVADLLM